MQTRYCVVIPATIAVVLDSEHPGQAAVHAHDALREQAFPKGVVRGPESECGITTPAKPRSGDPARWRDTADNLETAGR